MKRPVSLLAAAGLAIAVTGATATEADARSRRGAYIVPGIAAGIIGGILLNQAYRDGYGYYGGYPYGYGYGGPYGYYGGGYYGAPYAYYGGPRYRGYRGGYYGYGGGYYGDYGNPYSGRGSIGQGGSGGVNR